MILAFSVFCAAVSAQDIVVVSEEADAVNRQDSVAVAPVTKMIVDSTLVGKSIFDIMPEHAKGDRGNVTVRQSYATRRAFERRVAANSFKEVSGYRVRIYFSNAQNARWESSAAAARFTEKYGTYSVYHNYVNPNFKVTVGDFRTKSEALELLTQVKRDFPSAFVVKDVINVK